MLNISITSEDSALLWVGSAVLVLFFIGLFFIERNKKIR
jgi:hypothetical protein